MNLCTVAYHSNNIWDYTGFNLNIKALKLSIPLHIAIKSKSKNHKNARECLLIKKAWK